nr:restriction endonuclease subunit S [Acinetobacter sp. YH12025]
MAKEDFVELQATAALFPDELVESELGEVPKGWEISKISKIGKVITGKTPSSKIENSFAEKGTFFITPTDIDTEVFVTNTNRYLSEYGEIAIKNSKVDAGSLCITCIGSQMGKVVITPKSAFTNQQINSILLFNSTLRNYIFLNLRQRRDEIFLIGSGGSTMPIINKSTFESLNLILPDLALIRKFDNFISPFFNNILSNSVENIELKNIRDALLPELLAGKINVSMLKDM